MKTVFLRILSIWFYIIFALLYLLIFPLHVIFLLLNKEWARDVSHRLNTFWGFTACLLSGIVITTVNRKKVDSRGVYVFAPNHSSYLDIPVCNIAIRNSFRYMGKAELAKIPLFGFMFRRLHISVDRSNRTASFRSVAIAKQKLTNGKRSMLIFPEGTIPDKSKVTLLRFKDGAFRAAVDTNTPIVPMAIIGADRALADNGKWLVRPTKIKVIFGDPIPTDKLGVDDIPELRDRVYAWIYEHLTGEKWTSTMDSSTN